MVKLIKVMLLLLLVVSSHKVESQDSIGRKVALAKSENVCFLCHQGQVTAPVIPILPIAELTPSITSQVLVSRFQRLYLIEYNASLRSVLRYCSAHENSLSLHRVKVYSTTPSYYSEPVSDYYVFTLKHIIV